MKGLELARTVAMDEAREHERFLIECWESDPMAIHPSDFIEITFEE